MPTPSPLSIATLSVTRLLKEEISYRAELAAQEKRLAGLKAEEGGDGDDENVGFRRGQEERAIQETRAVFAPLDEKISAAVEKVQELLNSGGQFDEKEVEEARDAVGRAKGRAG